MSITQERIVQAEEGIAQVQKVLDHAQDALAVAGQVEEVASRSRNVVKILAVATLIGLVVLVIMKVAGGRSTGPELTVVENPPGDDDEDGGPAA
ncbi:MAG: hypothetical protein ACR2OH_09650 [Microthrixaceae bacterium]